MSLLKKAFAALTPRERWVLAAALAVIIVSILVLGIIFLKNHTHSAPAMGGTYREGLVDQPTSINPVLAQSTADKSLVRLIFSNVPSLADSIQVDPQNPDVWHVRLKEGLLWQDGQKLTSDDVLFTIQQIQDPTSQSPLAASWQGITATRVSELEIQFTLATPYAFFPETLQNLYVVPKHLFADVPVANWHLSQYNLEPVGSGPYMFQGYDKSPNGFINDYVLVPNPHFAGTPPLIQTFELAFFDTSADMLRSFNEGKIDGFIDTENTAATQIERPYTTTQFSIPGYYALFMNQSNNTLLQNKDFREALSLAINRSQLVSEALHGNGVTAYGPLPESLFPSPTSSTAYSPVTADQLLDTLGWTLGSDGMRTQNLKKSSSSLEVTLTVPNVDFLVQTAHQIQAAWQAVGVQTKLDIEDPNTITQTIIPNRSYQILLFGNILDLNNDLFSFWDSSQSLAPGLNLSLYSNPQVDTLLEDTRSSFNSTTRQQNMAQLQSLIEQDYPAIFLYSPTYPYITSKELGGIQGSTIADIADHLDNAAQWYVRTARVFGK